MILQGLLIVLVLLICANIGLAMWNKIDPPCSDNAKEYFKNSSSIGDDAIKTLADMPNKMNKAVNDAMGNANSASGRANSIEGMGYVMSNHTSKQKEPHMQNEKKEHSTNKLDSHIATMIDELFTSPNDDVNVVANDKHRSVAEFEVKMEGVKSRNSFSSAGTGDKVFSTISRKNTEREGYS